jgi:hypothetical protein
VIGAVLACVNFLTCIQLGFSARESAVSAGLVLFTNLAAALGVGQIDQYNAKRV